MSQAARERARMRRAHRGGRRREARREPDEIARDAGLEAEPAAVEGDDADDEPAESTVSENRHTLAVQLRERELRFLRTLAEAEGTTPERLIDRCVREMARTYRPSSGASMRLSEFDDG